MLSCDGKKNGGEKLRVSIRVLLLAGIWMRIFPRFLSVIL